MPDPVLPPNVLAALGRGNKIDAIRLLRESRGLGLAEAKALIDAHERANRPPQTRSGLSPGQAESSNTTFIAVAALVVAAVVGYLFLTYARG
jgi:ribosomal protein L7/L12